MEKFRVELAVEGRAVETNTCDGLLQASEYAGKFISDIKNHISFQSLSKAPTWVKITKEDTGRYVIYAIGRETKTNIADSRLQEEDYYAKIVTYGSNEIMSYGVDFSREVETFKLNFYQAIAVAYEEFQKGKIN